MLRLFLGMILLVGAAQAAELENAGFEAAEVTSGWTVEARPVKADARKPILFAEEHEIKAGKRALLVAADDPSNVSVRQRLHLPVGSVWRVKAWARVEKLSGEGGSGAIVEIRTPAGNIGESSSKIPEATWQERETLFRVPSPGVVDVTLVGLRKAAGKVWFDDVRLEPFKAPGVKEARILPQRLTKRAIDVKQGGQFIEILCNLIPSITAQQVDSSSFEEEPPWKVSYKPPIDKPDRPWYPDGAVHLAGYSYDAEAAYNGKRSQKIELPAARARAGIAQDGFYTKAGVAYQLRLHMKSLGNVSVRASLRAGEGAVAKPVLLGRAGAEWGAAETRLVATRGSENATLSIQFEGPGTLWLDQIYLIGEDAVLGIWRPDVVEALRAMKPGVIRFGGSSIEPFEWEQAIGPWDRRVPFTTPWGGLEPNFASVEEFVQLCEYLKVEPLVCLRWTGKTPADAAAQVEYFNGGPDTPEGKRRAQNGRRAPYRVKYWQIGNEVGGREYDASVKAFAEAMRKVDPTIKVLSAFPSADTLARGEGYLDYLCPHHYECGDLEGKEKDLKFLQDQIGRYGRGRDIRVAVTEWNTTAGEWGLGRGMLQTLGNALACARYHNLMQRYADLIEIAIRSNLADSFGSGVILTGPGWMYFAPTYYAQQMYARAAGTHPLRVELASNLPWQLQEPDVTATLSEDGRTLRIFGVNSTTEALPVTFDLSGFEREVSNGRLILIADRDKTLSAEVMNTQDDPKRVAAVDRPLLVRGKKFVFTFEPLSVSLMELRM
jgi:alpha-N-arabinofuranosidase